MKATFLPGISAVSYCPASRCEIDNQRRIDNTSVVDVSGDFVYIPIHGLGSVTVKTEVASGQTLFTTKLNFFLPSCVPDVRQLLEELSRIPSCFRFRDIGKQEYILGGQERPFPTVLFDQVNEDDPTGRKGYIVEITYVNTHSYHLITS